VVPGRAHQGICQAVAFEELAGGGQGAFYRPPGRQVGVAVYRGEGIYAVVAGADGQLFGRARYVADGEDIGIDGLPRRQTGAHLLEVIDELVVVHRPDVFLGESPGGYLAEELGLIELG